MSSGFTADFFAGNRQRLRALFTGTAPMVITANGLLQRNTDTAFPFQQDASFWYLTGIDEPDIILVIDRDKEYLIVPKREAIREAFDGEISPTDIRHISGIKTVLNEAEGWDQLGARLKKVKHVATLAANPVKLETFAIYTNPARRLLIEQLKTYSPDIELLDIRLHIARLRMVKQPVELAAIQRAIDVTVASIKAALKPAKLTKYRYEYELEAAISHGFRSRGARGNAFDPIIAGGKNAATIHSLKNSDPLTADELVVVDVGAEVDHYAADITRTVAIGKPSRRQEAIHEAVLAVQEYAIGLLKPGKLIRDYEHEVEAFMGEKLRELGLIKSIDHTRVRRYYPHACTHFLGLDPHDAGDYDHPLEPGMVLTVEPGIYIPKEGIGVRIEDDVMITKTGAKVLSAKLPKTLY